MFVFLLGLVGCYAPQPVPGAPCSADGTCPSGLVCTDDRCVLPGTTGDASIDEAPIDTSLIDASIDASIDAFAGPIPQLVQEAFMFEAPATTLTTTFPGTPIAGNVLVAVAGCPTGAIAAISGAAATWQRVALSTVNPNVEVYIGVATGGTSVTISLPTCTSQMSLAISEWNHVDAMPLDTMSIDDGVASPSTAGSITTSGSPRLLLFAVANFTPNTVGTPTDGPWKNLMPIVGLVEIRIWYRVVTTTGSFAPTVTETRHEWDAALVSLKGD